MPLKIIICGGGIGGLTAAGYLRAHNHDVTVLERGQLDPSSLSQSESDYGLSVIANAFNLLLKAGIKMENMDCVPMTHTWRRNRDNEELVTKHFDTRLTLGAPSVLTRRGELVKELLRFATGVDFPGQPAGIVCGVKVVRVDADAGKVWTDDGREFGGDLIVGADGINSLVRTAVLGKEENSSSTSAVRTHDLLLFMTSLSVSDLGPDFSYLADPASQAGLASFTVNGDAPSKKRILAYHVSAKEMQVIGYTSEKEFAEIFDSARTTIIKHIPKARVVDGFSPDFCDGIVDLFRRGGRRIDAWRIRDVASLQTWFRGKVVVIGDAAHAVTPHAGQGCNITIEDAEALAYLLRGVETSDDLQAILQKFMALRKDRAGFVNRRSREIGDLLSDAERKLEPIDIERFAKEVLGYQGVEQILGVAPPTLAFLL